MLTVAGGQLSTGTASTAMRTIFPRSLLFWTFGEETKKSTGRTNFNCLAPRCWSKVVQTKSRQTLMFDPSGSTGRLRACPFLGGWRTLVWRGFRLDAIWYLRLERVFGSRRT